MDEQADTKEKETIFNSAADGELYQELSDEEGESDAIPINVGESNPIHHHPYILSISISPEVSTTYSHDSIG